MSDNSQIVEFNRPEVVRLLQDIVEATRARPGSGVVEYVPPAGSEMAAANYHHFIFGQRGSGKSSLLRHLQQTLEQEKRVTVWMDQEIFANLDYPDVLVSCILMTMEQLKDSLGERPTTPRSWWESILGRPPRPVQDPLHEQIDAMIENFATLKMAPADRTIQWTHKTATAREIDMVGTLSLKGQGASISHGRSRGADVTTVETIEISKHDYLEKCLVDLRSILLRSSKRLNGGFIFMDDVYQLNRSDQPRVLGYMHRLVKDTGLWLKIGTLRNMTTTYRGDPPTGMQVRHDAQQIQLDRQFSNYQNSRRFLEEILTQLCAKSQIDLNALFTRGALDRLMLASGGVARDYLDLSSGAIKQARNRGVSSKSGTTRVIVEDVNSAAADVAPGKLTDLKVDAPDEARALEARLTDLTNFCRHTKRAYFLVDTQDETVEKDVAQLQNLRFANLIVESETVRQKGSDRFNVWMLDLAMLSHQRAAQKVSFEGWQQRDQRRQRRLIYHDDWQIGDAPETLEGAETPEKCTDQQEGLF